MFLKDFHAFFETMTALNLGYAGFESVRERVGRVSLWVFKSAETTFNKNHKKLKDKIEITRTDDSDTKTKEDLKILTDIEETYKNIYESATDEKEDLKVVSDIFLGPFFGTGLMTLIIITAIGFEQFIAKDTLTYIFLFGLSTFLLYNIWVLIYGVDQAFSNRHHPILNSTITLFFILIVTITIVLVFSITTRCFTVHPLLHYITMSFLIFVSFSPYLFLFLRIAKIQRKKAIEFNKTTEVANNLLQAMNDRIEAELKTQIFLNQLNMVKCRNGGKGDTPIKPAI